MHERDGRNAVSTWTTMETWASRCLVVQPSHQMLSAFLTDSVAFKVQSYGMQ